MSRIITNLKNRFSIRIKLNVGISDRVEVVRNIIAVEGNKIIVLENNKIISLGA